MLKEECGIAGVIGTENAAHYLHLALFALQHRGQEGCGVVTGFYSDTEKYKLVENRNFGLVSDNFDPEVLVKLKGKQGIGHVRYSTHGGRLLNNVQPFTFALPRFGPMALAHNGNITNAKELRNELEDLGSLFRTTSDSEVFLHLLARSKAESIEKALQEVMQKVDGAYSLVVLTENELLAVRDPFGFRPLVLGQRKNEHDEMMYVAASETCVFDLLEAQYIREVEPGEVVKIKNTPGAKIESFKGSSTNETRFCSFEPIYFSRPDSMAFDKQIYMLRKNLGKVLAEEQPAPADVVIAIPDSGVPMAMGYAEASGIPYQVGLVRNHYVGRTFIEPTQSSRDFRVRLKLNPMPSVLKGKSVVVIDDSVVRGTTCVKILDMLRKAGAAKIHFRVASPPITHSCFYGVDTPNRTRLMAAQKSIQEMREIIGADTLAFLSVEGLKKALADAPEKSRYCFACFTGNYPSKIHREIMEAPTDKTSGPGLGA